MFTVFVLIEFDHCLEYNKILCTDKIQGCVFDVQFCPYGRPTLFFLKLKNIYPKASQMLATALTEFAENNPVEDNVTFTQGQYCLFLMEYSNINWRRGIVLKVLGEGQADILSIDEGIIERYVGTPLVEKIR